MSVVRLTLAYDGTGFRGWARQRNQRTVQGAVETVLERVLGAVPRLSVAGRTDAGVHALGQVVSFPSQDELDVARLQRALNGMLAPEVVCLDARAAPEGFDARFSATAREYRYRIDVGPWPDPFEARYVWHRPGEPSLTAMRAAARDLVGEHDFASFCRRPPQGNTVRRLERLGIRRLGDRIEISARAPSFLHQMVRSLTGTLVAVGEGYLDPGSMPEILSARTRAAAGPVAPAHGLTLERVVYGRGDGRVSRRPSPEGGSPG
jgi:tRNA pseudouridine38-40 synthase